MISTSHLTGLLREPSYTRPPFMSMELVEERPAAWMKQMAKAVKKVKNSLLFIMNMSLHLY